MSGQSTGRSTVLQTGDTVDMGLPHEAFARDTHRLRSRVFHVDSRARNVAMEPSASDFTVRFPVPLRGVRSIRLKTAMVPMLIAAVHGVNHIDPYVVLQSPGVFSLLEGVSGLRSGGAVADVETGNSLADDGGLVVIPLEAAAEMRVGGGATVVEFAVWKESDHHQAVQYFTPPLRALDRLRLRLSTWGSAAASRTHSLPYALGNETAGATDSDPSGLNAENNVCYVIEIVAEE